MYQLTAKSGFAKGAAWSIPVAGLLIGRDTACGVVVGDPIVSRRHCVVNHKDGQLFVEDLGSSNTTLVNGEPVSSRQLCIGDELAIGRATFLVTALDRAASTLTDAAHDRTTKSIRSGEAIYLDSDGDAARLAGQPRTVQHLARLFRVSRTLSSCASVAAVESGLMDELKQDFPGGTVYITRVDPAGQLVHDEKVLAALSAIERDLLVHTLSRAHHEQIGLLVPQVTGSGAERHAIVALGSPISLGSERIGGVGVLAPMVNNALDEDSLDYLCAVATAAASNFLAAERLEVLTDDLARLKHTVPHGAVMLGHSKAIGRVRGMARMAARSTMPVLITGATGTGKELVAQMVQQLSERANRPYEIVNCAAIPEELFESEVFGYDKYAFTGAGAARAGLLEQCNGGVLFLDEIGDLSLRNQARLLRAVETQRFRRVGGRGELIVDVRFIAATNKDLEVEIREGRFRSDLFHRLAGIEIRVPTLDQRRSDIADLAPHFFQEARYSAKRPVARLEEEAIEFLRKRSWPGNVRELRSVVMRAVLLASRSTIGVAEMQAASRAIENEDFLPITLDENEKLHIMRTLEACSGIVPEAARILGVSRSTLYRKLSDLGIGTS